MLDVTLMYYDTCTFKIMIIIIVTIFCAKIIRFCVLNNLLSKTLLRKYANNKKHFTQHIFAQKNGNKDYLFCCVCDNFLSVCTSILFYAKIVIDYVYFVVVRCTLQDIAQDIAVGASH